MQTRLWDGDEHEVLPAGGSEGGEGEGAEDGEVEGGSEGGEGCENVESEEVICRVRGRGDIESTEEALHVSM